MIKHIIHFTDCCIDYDFELKQLQLIKIPKKCKINEIFSSMIICEKANYGTLQFAQGHIYTSKLSRD